MQPSVSPTPQAISANIHANALRRVTRMFTATLGDIFAELFQNARRAGATRIRVTLARHVAQTGHTVIVDDDGAGVVSPDVLLSFAANGWSEALVRREDAAGMGLLSLARRGCSIASRRSVDHDNPWRVDLAPEHFLGDACADVHPDAAAPSPQGTTVTFHTTEADDPKAIRAAVDAAAWHHPLRVYFAHLPHTPPGGERVDRRAFLDGALHVERWRGLVLGVFRDRWAGFGRRDPDLNFHGITVKVNLPRIEAVSGAGWTVAADVDDCPDLELVLPARKEAVESPFLEELRDAARLAIYRAMAAQPDPQPAFDDWRRAKAAGIDIPAPAPALLPWRPGRADPDHWEEPPQIAPVGQGVLLMAYDPEPPEAHALWRAARRFGTAAHLFAPDRRLEGYAWYDTIQRVSRVDTCITTGDTTVPLDHYAVPGRTGVSDAPAGARVDAIWIRLVVARDGAPDRQFPLPADVAFAGEAWSWIGDAFPLVAPDSDIAPCELAALLRAAFFSPSDAAGADSWETQSERFAQQAHHIATRLLCSDDEARRASIVDAVIRDLCWLVPPERGADITIRERNVTVTFADP